MEIFENNFSPFRCPVITPLLTLTTLLLAFFSEWPTFPPVNTRRLLPIHLAPLTFASVYSIYLFASFTYLPNNTHLLSQRRFEALPT